MLCEKGVGVMKRRTKIWLTVASSFLTVGLILFAAVMSGNQWDFTKLKTGSYATHTFEITEPFSNISISAGTADLVFVPSKDQTGKITCFEEKTLSHSVAIEGDTLVIREVDNRRWYDYIGIHQESPKITICIPRGDYGQLTIQSNTGSVNLPKDFVFQNADIAMTTGFVETFASAKNAMSIRTTTGSIVAKALSAEKIQFTASTGKIVADALKSQGNIEVTVDTGKVECTNVQCDRFTSVGKTGDILLTGVIASRDITLNRSTGDIRLVGCDAGALQINTSTGDVTGSLLSEKIFFPQTSTGEIVVPKTKAGGECQITTSTGDIQMEVIPNQ